MVQNTPTETNTATVTGDVAQVPPVHPIEKVRAANTPDQVQRLLSDEAFVQSIAALDPVSFDLLAKDVRSRFGITKKAIAAVIARVTMGGGGGGERERYALAGGRICELVPTAHGPMAVPLAHGDVRICEERWLDDGAERQLFYVVEGRTVSGKSLPRTVVRADEFGTFVWLHRAWGTAIPIAAAPLARERLREAVETLSDPLLMEISRHTGWRIGEDRDRIFCHAGGAVGGGMATDLEAELSRYRLPDPLSTVDPKTPAKIRDAVRASLELLQVGPTEVMVPLLAMTYAGPLRPFLEVAFSVFLVGKSGNFKTALAALAMAHFGDFTPRTLPGNWASTSNYLEHILFRAADVLCVADDYTPQAHNRGELRRNVERVLRAMANGSSRGRLFATCEARPNRPPRCALLCTGEEMPDGASLVARLVRIDVRREDIHIAKLTAAQKRTGTYPIAMRYFIEWIIARWNVLARTLPRRFEAARARYTVAEAHARQPEALAVLDCVMLAIAAFAWSTQATTFGEARRLLRSARGALLKVGEHGAREARESAPARVFVATLGTLYASCRIQFAERRTAILGSDKGNEAIGWIDDKDPGFVFIDPTLAYRVVSRFLAEMGSDLGVSQRMLARHLHADGYLIAPCLEREHRYDVQIVVGQGPLREKRRTWKMSMSHLREMAAREDLVGDDYAQLLS